MILADYLLPTAVVAFFGWRMISSALARKRIPGLLDQGGQVVDVRTTGEFAAGHAPGSVNIPLADLEHGTKALDRNRPVILCCASGTRSAMACRTLRTQGFTQIMNGGSWRNLPRRP